MLIGIEKITIRARRRLCVYHNAGAQGRKSMLFLHDPGGYARQWRYQWRHFRRTYNVVAFDMLGHGLSDAPNTRQAYSLCQLMLDAQAVFERFCHAPVILCCQGRAHWFAAILAALYPRQVSRIIIISPRSIHQMGQHWPYALPLWVLNMAGKLGNALLSTYVPGHEAGWLPSQRVRKLLAAAARRYGVPVEPALPGHKVLSITHEHRSKDVLFLDQPLADKTQQRLITSYSRFVMMAHPQRVNRVIDRFVEKLNIQAFRNLVFEGAGVRGIAYSGAILALESLGILQQIEHVAGASVGSFYAMFLALGCSGNEIYETISDLDYTLFISGSGNFLSSSTRLLTDFGWYSTHAMYEWISNFIAARTGQADLTFRGLRRIGKRDLYLTATNMSKSCSEVFSYETTPDMEIREAVAISSSIPLYFKATRRKTPEGEMVMVDGGLSRNYPLDIFDEPRWLRNPQNGERMTYQDQPDYCFNHETLGFRLEPLEDPLNEHYRPKSYQRIRNIVDYGRAFMAFVQAAYVKRHLLPCDWNRTVFIDTEDTDSTNFTISRDKVDRLVEAGKMGVKKHFAWRMSREGMRFPQ